MAGLFYRDPEIQQGVEDKRLSMVGVGRGNRSPSMQESGQEGQGTIHREGRRDRGP